MSAKYRVLFLCVHNAARSQMAEALLRKRAGDIFDVESAGFEPRPVLPLAVSAMRQIGIDISSAKSKTVFALYQAGRIFDYVIAVCDEATAEQCPVFPGVCERLQWGFPDPSAVEGDEVSKLREVVAIREAIEARIEQWLTELERRGGPAPKLGARKES